MIGFIIGVFIGGTLGFLLTAVLSADAHDKELRKVYNKGKSIGYNEGFEDGSKMR